MCVWDVACAQIEKSTDTWSSPKTDRQATLPPQRRTYLLFGILLKSRTYAVGTESVVRHVRAADMSSRSSTPLAICPQLRRGILERRSPPTRPRRASVERLHSTPMVIGHRAAALHATADRPTRPLRPGVSTENRSCILHPKLPIIKIRLRRLKP